MIISAIVISFGVITNRATSNVEPGNFYDYSYEIKRESGAVLDYKIYRGFEEGVDVDEFVDLLTEDIKDKNPNANFVIAYGSSTSGVKVKNEGKDSVEVDGEEIEGDEGGLGEIRHCSGHSCISVETDVGDYDGEGELDIAADELSEVDSIEIEFGGHFYTFQVSEYSQVFFIIQEDEGDESYVATG